MKGYFAAIPNLCAYGDGNSGDWGGTGGTEEGGLKGADDAIVDGSYYSSSSPHAWCQSTWCSNGLSSFGIFWKYKSHGQVEITKRERRYVPSFIVVRPDPSE
jgi:hypothetical protein